MDPIVEKNFKQNKKFVLERVKDINAYVRLYTKYVTHVHEVLHAEKVGTFVSRILFWVYHIWLTLPCGFLKWLRFRSQTLMHYKLSRKENYVVLCAIW